MGEGRRVEDKKQETKKSEETPLPLPLRRFPPVIKQLAKKI